MLSRRTLGFLTSVLRIVLYEPTGAGQSAAVKHEAALPFLVLVLGAAQAGCVTERVQPAVSIHAGVAGSIYPPVALYGTWVSGDRTLAFQRPPAAAVHTSRASSHAEYDIAALRRNTDGSYTMRLASRSGGPEIERTFYIPSRGLLREVDGSETTDWSRRHE